MYRKISTSFKEQSKQIKNTLYLISTPVIYLIALAIVLYILDSKDKLYDWVGITLIITFYLITFLTFYLIILYFLKENGKFKWRKIWNIPYNVKLFKETNHDRDIELLIEILKENGINTRPKVLEVVRHYQCIIPHRSAGGTSIISVLALCISILAFIFSDYFLKSEFNQIATVVIITLVVLIYIAVYTLNKNVFRYVGENALNERLEMAASEIWIKSLIK